MADLRLVRHSALAIALGLWPGMAAALTGAECAVLFAGVQAMAGQEIKAGPPVVAEGWCVLDAPVLGGAMDSRPTISADVLRLRPSAAGDLTALDVAVAGLRVTPKIGDRAMDDRLRSFLRMQTADLSLSVADGPESLEVRQLVVTLPGRNRLAIGADIRGARLADPASLFGGKVTRLDIDLVTDGRVARPVMQMAGERMGGGEPMAAVRAVLAEAVVAMPASVLDRDARFALTRFIDGLPQTTGRLQLRLTSDKGISAADIAINGMRADPIAPQALAQLFGGGVTSVIWQPGVTQ